MGIGAVRDFIKEKAEQFGAKNDNEFNRSYIERNNTKPDSLKDNGAYFGLIYPEEENSGPYHDFSLTIFPNDEDKPWLVCLGVGSLGFKNDYELSTYPGLRRLFINLTDENGYCKGDFSDIEASLPRTFVKREDIQHIRKTIQTYTKVLPVCQIVDDPESEEGRNRIAAFVAAYAKLRNWPTNKEHRKSVLEALQPFMMKRKQDILEEIQNLVDERKYLVLEGPPGTGKTRTAKKVANGIGATTFFTQFHAETTYSDFIYGIRPDLGTEGFQYVEKLGAFSEALIFAQNNPEEIVVLIIDEINRANLSNVLGPVFYLFEHKMEISNVEIEIFPGLKIEQLPRNFNVIATMNTADRSLAVVDFALRRRFAWYSLKPEPIVGQKKKLGTLKVLAIEDSKNYFFSEDFSAIDEIFNWFASSNELSLQPGQGYFLAESMEDMHNRIEYEIFPLIKEYLQEGLMLNAKEELNDYFSNRISKSLFE